MKIVRACWRRLWEPWRITKDILTKWSCGLEPKRLKPHRDKVGALEDRVGALEDRSPQETMLEAVLDIGLEPLRLVPQNWQGWNLGNTKSVLGTIKVGALEVQVGAWKYRLEPGDWRLVSSSRVGALHILYLIYCKEENNKSIYHYCSFCVLNISDLIGKNNNWKEILIHPPLSISNIRVSADEQGQQLRSSCATSLQPLHRCYAVPRGVAL